MTAELGADELRIRSILKQRGVGPDAGPDTETPARAGSSRLPDWWAPKPGISPAGPPAIPPKPVVRPRDWLDDIIANPTPDEEPPPEQDQEPEPEAAPAAPEKPAKRRPKRGKKKPKRPKPDAARTAWDTRPPAPRQSLTEAWDRIPHRLKWLAYHASAAYMGWSLGLVGWSTYVTAWIAHTGYVGVQAFFWYTAAGTTVLVYRRTRHWWTPVAWLAAVPVSSTVVGVLLYAPTT